jgi:protein-tyrosine phosphatase
MKTPTLDATPNRIVPFESIVNFRELGGLRTAGGSIRSGAVFRSATLHLATAADAGRLDAFGISTVIDLRSDEELDRWPGQGAWTPTRVVHAPLLRQPWSADDLLAQTNPSSFLAARYCEMLEGSSDIAIDVIETISEAPGPVLFHCSAGKDRTGVIAALLLGMLGVDDDKIIEDYHATSAAMDDLIALFVRSIAAERSDSEKGPITDRNDRDIMVSQPPAFMTAPAEAMEITLGAVRQRWGSIAGYARTVGISDTTIDRLRARLLD